MPPQIDRTGEYKISSSITDDPYSALIQTTEPLGRYLRL